MIPVVYNYHCLCGYHYVAQEQVQAAPYIRLLIDNVVLCPECKQPLQPKVQVAYASLPATETTSQEIPPDERKEEVG
jgi:hypothetical protein